MVRKGRGSNEGESCFPRQQGGWLRARLTPWMPCGPSSPPHGCCTHTHYHTCGQKQKGCQDRTISSIPSSTVPAPPPCPTQLKREASQPLPVEEAAAFQPPANAGRRRLQSTSLHRRCDMWKPPDSAGALCITRHHQLAVTDRTEACNLSVPAPTPQSHPPSPPTAPTRKPASQNGRSVQCQHSHRRWRNGCHH